MTRLRFLLAVAFARRLPSHVLRALADARLVEELEASVWKDLPSDRVIQ